MWGQPDFDFDFNFNNLEEVSTVTWDVSGTKVGYEMETGYGSTSEIKFKGNSDFSFGSDILFIIFLLPLFPAVICSAITSRLILAAWSLSMHTDTVTSSLESTPSFSRKSILKKVSLKRIICRKEINREISYMKIKFD